MNQIAFITSDFSESQLTRLNQRLRVQRGGWGMTGEKLSPDELIESAQDAHILVVGYEQVTEKVIQKLPKLKLVGCTRSTPVNIHLVSATARSIPVLHTPGRNTVTAAEFTMGLMLSAAHRIACSHHALRSDKYLGPENADLRGFDPGNDITWKLDGESPFKDFQGIDLHGRTLGIIGLGKIGNRVAQLAQAFDMQVIAYSPYSDSKEAEDIGVELVPLDDLMRRSDFISIHARVTPESSGLIGEEQFKLMKPSAYLISSSRAAIIDQTALIQALEQHRIAGAALDVYWYEPLPRNHPLLHMDNVALTPHLAGASRDVIERHSQMIVDDILAWLDGKRPQHIANPEVFR